MVEKRWEVEDKGVRVEVAEVSFTDRLSLFEVRYDGERIGHLEPKTEAMYEDFVKRLDAGESPMGWDDGSNVLGAELVVDA